MDLNKRISDTERDAAVQSLREHASVGRLSLEEFDERMEAALAARTQRDLVRLFEDLPGGLPVSDTGLQVRRRDAASQMDQWASYGSANRLQKSSLTQNGLIAAIWIVFFVCVGIGLIHWWLFWIPLIVSGIIKK